MGKLVYGVGINDADYVTQLFEPIVDVCGKKKQKRVWVCPFYEKWKDMLKRAYSEKLKLRRPTYGGITVTKEWHLFSTFKSWMEAQDWEGKHLDKDLLIPGNKVYSPETSVFVSRLVNTFLTDRCNDRGDCRLGCHWHKQAGKYVSMCSDPFTNKQGYLGLFHTEQEAHRAWLAKKLEHAYALAAIQTDERVAKALIDRYENYKELF